ncbi:MAG: macro domain-containing protein [Solirubrobacterales bacterium]
MPGSVEIAVVEADLTREAVDAIVNAANGHLANGGGVAGAISRAAGPELQRACDELIAERGPLAAGEAVATPAFDLPARHVVHTVGPVYGRHDGEEAALLKAAHVNAIEMAGELGVRSLSLPAISCGIYGYPVAEAAPIAVAAVREYAAEAGIELVRFCFIGGAERQAFAAALAASAAG